MIKLVFQGKREFYVFCYDAILKDRVLIKKTLSSNEIDVNVVKKHMSFLNFFEKYGRSTLNVPIPDKKKRLT